MNWNFDVLPDFIFNGLSLGAIYGTVALALVLIFKATTLINFATGELNAGTLRPTKNVFL